MVNNKEGYEIDSMANYYHRVEQNKAKFINKKIEEKLGEVTEDIKIIKNGGYSASSKNRQLEIREHIKNKKLTGWL